MLPKDPWLDLALDGVNTPEADRVRAFRMLMNEGTRLRGLLDRTLAPSGLTSQQGAMLSWIQAQPRPPTISAVAAGLGMTHQNVKQIAAALARKGFVTIEVGEHDRRARHLVRTDHHHRFWQARNPDDFSAVQGWTAAWSDAEVQQLLHLLARLHRHLDGDGARSGGTCQD
jgi:DNA-binding MarR family transcriptional regulator